LHNHGFRKDDVRRTRHHEWLRAQVLAECAEDWIRWAFRSGFKVSRPSLEGCLKVIKYKGKSHGDRLSSIHSPEAKIHAADHKGWLIQKELELGI